MITTMKSTEEMFVKFAVHSGLSLREDVLLVWLLETQNVHVYSCIISWMKDTAEEVRNKCNKLKLLFWLSCVVSRKDKIPYHVRTQTLVFWEISTKIYTVAVSNEEVTQILKCQVIKNRYIFKI
jgi:hypothetical protein